MLNDRAVQFQVLLVVAGLLTFIARHEVGYRSDCQTEPTPLDWKLDVNEATVEEFAMLPKIGPATATRIIDHRDEFGRFESLADLKQVSGIGPATIMRLQHRLEVREVLPP